MLSANRLQEQLEKIKELSRLENTPGCNRLAFTDNDWKVRDYIITLMNEAGLSVRIDAFGNVIGRREGNDPQLPAVLVGSHTDSVPEGGNFDGVIGVLGGIEIARHFSESRLSHDHPLEIILFMCEESSRFGAATLGSRAMRGELSMQDLKTLHDKNGITLYEVLGARGLHPERVEKESYDHPVKAFLEMHIEQGRVLEHAQKNMGIVTGIAAPTRMILHIHGNADHSGATPMPLRKDGLCAAAEIVLAVEKHAQAKKDPAVVGTVGMIQVQPNAMNVIPGETALSIDIRSISEKAKAEVADAIKAQISETCQKRELTFTIEDLGNEKPAVMHPSLCTLFAEICQQTQTDFMHLPSGAGHDAMHWADFTPTGMLFIPCKNGISHNPLEEASLEDIFAATCILEKAVAKALLAETIF